VFHRIAMPQDLPPSLLGFHTVEAQVAQEVEQLAVNVVAVSRFKLTKRRVERAAVKVDLAQTAGDELRQLDGTRRFGASYKPSGTLRILPVK
jgi:hypothetical protein